MLYLIEPHVIVELITEVSRIKLLRLITFGTSNGFRYTRQIPPYM